MRRLISTVMLFCACAAAQLPKVETFDRSGLPSRARTDTERELMRRTSAHRRGDVADAVEIQRMLAAYYRGQGDEDRARAAEERANAAAAYGGVPLGVQAVPKPPAPRPIAAPVRAVEPIGESVPISVYQPEAGTATKPPATAPLVEALPEPEPALPDEAPTPASPQQPAPSGRFYVLQGQTMHSWEFRPDGTFEHGWAGTRPGAAAQMEAGKFTVAGPYITLFVLRGSSGGAAGRPSRRMRFQARGPAGKEGLLLDGLMLTPGTP